jgi:hypothetical protein
VDGAVGYEVALNGPGGGIYWAGWATGTSIPVGGEPLIDPGLSGPSVSAGMTWSVAAYDADGNLMAVSVIQAIAPLARRETRSARRSRTERHPTSRLAPGGLRSR